MVGGGAVENKMCVWGTGRLVLLDRSRFEKGGECVCVCVGVR